MKKTRTRMVTLRMTPEDNEAIEKAARDTYRSKSELITYCTMRYLADHPRDFVKQPRNVLD